MRKRGLIKKKRGISPVVTSILLVAMTIVLVSIVFLWFRGLVEESVTKFGKNIKLVCDDVQFEASYSSGVLSVVNNGNIPIFRLSIRMSQGGSFQTKDITDLSSSWPEIGLDQGGAFSESINIGSANKITVFPVLVGTSSKGKKTYVCEGAYGKEIDV